MRPLLLFFGAGLSGTAIPVLYHSVNGNPEAVRWVATCALMTGLAMFFLGVVISKKRAQ